MDNNILTIALSGIFALISTVTVNIVASIISKRQRSASAQKDEGDAAESLSNATRTQLETYNTQILAPMRTQMDSLRTANTTLEEKLARADKDMESMRSLIVEVKKEISGLSIRLVRADAALEFICNMTRPAFLKEVEMAYKIRRGELSPETNPSQ